LGKKNSKVIFFTVVSVSESLLIAYFNVFILMQPQWMAPEVLRNGPSNEK
jgi:hypothetical protein